MLPDMTSDMLGIGLGLGEEIAVAERAGKMSQEDEGVLGSPVLETGLVTIGTPKEHNLVDLTLAASWLVPLSKKLKSPFIEKWKRVALGLKSPEAPLLTYEEKSAYQLALRGETEITDTSDMEIKEIAGNIQRLKRVHLKGKVKAIFEEIKRRRCLNGKG